VTSNDILRAALIDELTQRQLPCGGWATSSRSRQCALEPSCLAALALGLSSDASGGLQDFLLRVQNPNGSWPPFEGDDLDGSWLASLAVIVLRDYLPGIPARLRGFHWLLKFAGKESNWFWKWKFRTTDRHVRFDPNKYGWPWFPETVSWVVPTSFAILAMNQIPCGCGDFEHAGSRVNLGIEMLIDRACPGGGWNAGNGTVYGAPMSPHVDDTAIALLALSRRKDDRLVQSGVLWLEKTIKGLRSPWSLAWSVLALAAHGRPIEFFLPSLRASHDVLVLDDTSTIAAVSLALDWQQTLSSFGVAI
jgi:hypothetical protein